MESMPSPGFDGEGTRVWPKGIVNDRTITIGSETLSASGYLFITVGPIFPPFCTISVSLLTGFD